MLVSPGTCGRNKEEKSRGERFLLAVPSAHGKILSDLDMDQDNFEQYKNKLDVLLKSFRHFSADLREPSLLDALQRPYDENLVSNLLAFFSDTRQPHGLGNLMARAFLRSCGIGEQTIPSNVTVTREYYTEGGNRLDLVLDTDANCVIGIENKIGAELYNPLDDYLNTLVKHFKGKQVYCIVLAPDAKDTSAYPKWTPVTYRQLWEHVRDMLGHYLTPDNLKWLPTFISLVDHTERMNNNQIEFSPMEKYLLDNREEIQKLVEPYIRVESKLSQSACALYESIRKSGAGLGCRMWLYLGGKLGGCLACDFDSQHCAVDFGIYLDHVAMSFFARNASAREIFSKAAAELQKRHPEASYHDGRLYLLEKAYSDYSQFMSMEERGNLEETVLAYLKEIEAIFETLSQNSKTEG